MPSSIQLVENKDFLVSGDTAPAGPPESVGLGKSSEIGYTPIAALAMAGTKSV
jgi:hypothetical protein